MVPFGSFYSQDVAIPAAASGLSMGMQTSGSSCRDGVKYQWIFHEGKLIAGVWSSERTHCGYHFFQRVL
ncbi:hypothetical protein DNAM_700 [Pseudomonas phage BroderSalsa]|nr:hypothetical protein DNAM_700 [Pseudomonas phage BroderSalsa]